MVFLGKRGEKAKKGKKSWKKAKIWPKMVIFDVFWKSSKKNFNFALIRPFFGGRAQALKMGVDFCPFWIETIWESVLRVPIRLLLSDAFFFAPGGPGGAPKKNGQNRDFWGFCDFWSFLVFFRYFWPFFVFFVVLAIFVFLVNFGLFLVFFQIWWFTLINALSLDFLINLGTSGVFRGFCYFGVSCWFWLILLNHRGAGNLLNFILFYIL